MSDLVQQIKEGKAVTGSSSSSSASTSKATGTNALGKDAFLQLLVTQMKYQDPLNPSSDTDYIAQLATFSQLEQLQNLSSAASNSQAYSLVGKTVVVKTDESKYVTGKVDYVYTSGSTTKFSINGTLYSSAQLDTVYDEAYMAKQNLPKIDTTKLSYNAASPKDLSFTVNLGKGDTIADDVAIAVNETLIDSSLVDVNGTKVTIKASAFKNLANGTHKVVVVFNDPQLTTVKDKVTLQVTNVAATQTASTPSTEGTTGTGTTGTGTTGTSGTSTTGTDTTGTDTSGTDTAVTDVTGTDNVDSGSDDTLA